MFPNPCFVPQICVAASWSHLYLGKLSDCKSSPGQSQPGQLTPVFSFHRANIQQPAQRNERQSKTRCPAYAICNILFASMYGKEFCCQLASLPNSDPSQAINCNSLPESVTITLLPTPSLQRLNDDEWSRQSTARPGPGQGQVHPRVSQPSPRSASGTAERHALAVILHAWGFQPHHS